MLTDLKIAALNLAVGLPPEPALAAPVCPKPPPGMQSFADDVTSWVKWGVLALIIIAALISIGSILVGRIFNHPSGARFGAMGIAITVLCAFLYPAVQVILASITGKGC